MTTSPAQPDASLANSPAWSGPELSANPHEHAQKADKVRRMFAAIARSYDLNNRLHSFGRDVAWRKTAVRLAGVKRTDEILDVACGTGDLTREFAKAGPRRAVGLDFTPQMLDIACEKSGVARGLRSNEAPSAGGRGGSAARGIGWTSGVTAVLPEYLDGDAMNLPFPDASFDIVSIAFGLRNVSDPAKALREFRRVMRPGGRLIVLEFSRPTNRFMGWANDIYTTKIMPLTATWISRDRSGAYKYLPKSVATFMTRGQMDAAIRAAGFSGVSPHQMTFGVCVCYVGRA